MMRIGMILDKQFPPDPRVENEAISLIKNNFDLYLFCLKYPKETPDFESINGLQVNRYQSNKLEYKLAALTYRLPFYTNMMAKKIENFLRQNNIEVIHVHDIRIAGAVFKANRLFKLPIVLDIHDNLPEIMKFYPHVQKFPGKYIISPKRWKAKEEQFIKKATKVFTVSNAFKNEILSRVNISEDKIKVVPNTVRKSFYENPLIDEAILERYRSHFVLLYLGDTGLRRGLLTAIEGVKELKKTIKKVKLVIVGQNSSDEILKKRVKQLDIESYVDFEGWKDVSLFPSYIKMSSVCICPLDRNKQHDVAYANKLFQYMSFAKPLLVSNALAQKNLIESINGGLVHIEKNSGDFANKILQLYHNKKLRNDLGYNGKKFIENEFSFETQAKELVDFYQNLKN